MKVSQQIHQCPTALTHLLQLGLQLVSCLWQTIAVGSWEHAHKSLTFVLLNWHHGEEKIGIHLFTLFSFNNGREGPIYCGYSRVITCLQSTFSHHLHTLLGHLKGIEVGIAFLILCHLDSDKWCIIDAICSFKLKFPCQNDLCCTECKPFLATWMRKNPAHTLQLQHACKCSNFVFIWVLHQLKALCETILWWLVHTLNPNLGLVFTFVVPIKITTPRLKEAKLAHVVLKGVARGTVQCHCRCYGLLLALYLEGELVIKLHELIESPLHFHASE
mmetsp:Transcript_4645/g.6941  ORF Transcript_4645/g.6941 Transcript_4645/m.6941 type:complete len:274 (+) Transcript_4645:173-994(+)